MNIESQICYVITDIEADGPDPGKNSMLSFASVACSSDGKSFSEFTINLKRIPGSIQDEGTMKWWSGNKEAWNIATSNQIEPGSAIRQWVDWLQTLPPTRIFVAHPLTFDSIWLDWYLQKFCGRRLFHRPREPGICFGTGIDIPSLIMARTGWPFTLCNRDHYPKDWMGDDQHSHCALDDARGYANLFGNILNGRVSLTKNSGE